MVGGGDAAIEDAIALTKFASSVVMLVRGEKLRASVAMQRRLEKSSIEIKWKTNLVQILGERVEKLVLDVEGQEETVEAEGLFFAIGHIPATGWLKSEGILDENGYVIVQSQIPNSPILQSGTYPMMTSIPGVFAAGDCVDHRYRQAATAVGMGVAAALDTERWLEAQ